MGFMKMFEEEDDDGSSCGTSLTISLTLCSDKEYKYICYS